MVAAYKESGSRCLPSSQDVSAVPPAFGPFTGEVTAGLLKVGVLRQPTKTRLIQDLDVPWTIIGHSERRDRGVALIVCLAHM